MLESRQNFRLYKHIDMTWSIPTQNIEGKGKIFNISLSGVLFETDKAFKPDHGLIVHLHSAQIPSLPQKGKLVSPYHYHRLVKVDGGEYS